MKKKKLLEALKLIKESFQTEEKFAEAKLSDGVTIIRYDGDKLDVGVAVEVVTEEGAILIPDETYTLEDGTKFTTVNGVISEVKLKAEEKPEDKPEEKKGEAMNEASVKSLIETTIKESKFVTEEALNEKVESLEKEKQEFSEQKEATEKENKELRETVQKQGEKVEAMFKLMEEMASEPSDKPAEKPDNKLRFSAVQHKKDFKADLEKLNKS